MASSFPTGLEPALLWQAFDLICSLPHGSGNEARLMARLTAWAEDHGFACKRDEVGNLLVQVPASPGCEDRQTIVLQGHVDMVCEKNADVDFDFASDAIQVELDGDWLTAVGTTLGADNGIGVAAGMAIATDPQAVHGPLELLMTLDEETGMTGAFGLQPGFVTGTRMLNLDTEEEGAIYVGCAGGGDVVACFPLLHEQAPEGMLAQRLEVKGLVGGHSGLDIHENRANAIKCLARVLLALDDAGVAFRLASLDGGSMRNAVPREARCDLLVSPGQADQLAATVAEADSELRAEFKATDPQLQAALEPLQEHPETVFQQILKLRLLRAMLATHSGVVAMSGDVPGLVETSTNLGVVRATSYTMELVNCCRSSKGSALEALRRSLEALYISAGASEINLDAPYPGWLPDMDSPLLAAALSVHQEMFGPAEIKAVHAGLECGLIGQACPGLDMISIGPDIRGAHSPTERVSVGSTARFYELLKGILAALD